MPPQTDDFFKAQPDNNSGKDLGSPVSDEALTLFSDRNLRSRATAVSLALLTPLDEENPPEIEGKTIDHKSPDHKNEVMKTLSNYELALRHHDAPLESRNVSRSSTNGKKENSAAQTNKMPERAPSKLPDNPKLQEPAKPQPAKPTEAELRAKAEQERAKQIAETKRLTEQLAGRFTNELVADLDKKINRADLPKDIENSNDARKWLEYARQENKKLVMDFSSVNCGYCTQMERQVYPSIQESDAVVVKVVQESLKENLSQFADKFGVSEGSITGFPYTAMFGPSNNYALPQIAEAGFMDLGTFKSNLARVR